MTKKPSAPVETPAPVETQVPAPAPSHPLPSSGGSYRIDEKGQLVPDTPDTAPETDA